MYGLPTAVANAGLGLGVGAMVFINTITIHSMLLLVSFRDQLGELALKGPK